MLNGLFTLMDISNATLILMVKRNLEVNSFLEVEIITVVEAVTL